jgi:hypothetical protein
MMTRNPTGLRQFWFRFKSEHVDQFVLVARDLAGFVLILDAAAIGDATIAAIERILTKSMTAFRIQKLVWSALTMAAVGVGTSNAANAAAKTTPTILPLFHLQARLQLPQRQHPNANWSIDRQIDFRYRNQSALGCLK